MPARPDRPSPKLMQRAVALLARREHGRAELRRKLQRHLELEQPAAAIDSVLDELERSGLLSEERFAQSVVRTRAARYGDARLKQELLTRGVATGAAAGALGALRGTELQRARALWKRRFSRAPASLQERARQGRFLQARGFSLEVIRKVLHAADTDAAED
jgi:regulatory protein